MCSLTTSCLSLLTPGCASPALSDLLLRGMIPQGRALVPGMGRGYDVTLLASPEREVYGVDIVEVSLAYGTVVFDPTAGAIAHALIKQKSCNLASCVGRNVYRQPMRGWKLFPIQKCTNHQCISCTNLSSICQPLKSQIASISFMITPFFVPFIPPCAHNGHSKWLLY